MADLAVWQRTIVDEKGDIIPGAEVSVRSYPGGSLITLYEGPDGAQVKGNPFSTGADGFARFWAESQRAEIVAHGAGSTIRWIVDLINADEVIGDAVSEATAAAAVAVGEAKAEADRAEAARDAAQLNARIFPTTADGLAATTDGDYFSVPSEDDDEYLILYRNDNGSAAEVERYPNASLVHQVRLLSDGAYSTLHEVEVTGGYVGFDEDLDNWSYSGGNPNPVNMLHTEQMVASGVITRLEIHTETASAETLIRIFNAPDGVDQGQFATVYSSHPVSLQAGTNVVEVLIPFRAGQYLGIFAPTEVVSRSVGGGGPQVAHGGSSAEQKTFSINPRTDARFAFRFNFVTGLWPRVLETEAEAASLSSDLGAVRGSVFSPRGYSVGYGGDLEAPDTDGAMLNAYNVLQQAAMPFGGFIDRLNIHAQTQGTVHVRVYDAPGGVEPGQTVNIVSSQAVAVEFGANHIDLSLPFQAGHYLGIYAPANVLSRAPTGPVGPVVSYGGTAALDPFTIFNTTARRFFFRLETTLSEIWDLNRRVSSLEEAPAAASMLSRPACLYLGGSGQSNMVGSDDAVTVRQEYGAKGFSNNDDTVQPLVAPLVGNQEYPGFGAARYLREAMMFGGGPSPLVSGSQIIIGRAARGGTAIADLSKTNDTYGVYANSLQQIAAALGEAGDNGFLHLGQMWVQGERDAVDGTSRSDYKSLIKQLAEDYDNDARDIAPGGYQRPLFAAQITSTLGYTSAPNGWEIAMAQLEAAHEHPLISMVGPLYHVGWSDDRHLDSQGYRIAGALLGRAVYHYATTGALFEALQVVDSYIDGDDIVLVYNRRGLVLDTTLIPLQVQHGFAVQDELEDDVAITNVAATGNEVRLTCASTPASGWGWTYGNLQATGMAPYLGGAGNLRDSAGDQEAIDGHPLHNWAVLQEGVLP